MEGLRQQPSSGIIADDTFVVTAAEVAPESTPTSAPETENATNVDKTEDSTNRTEVGAGMQSEVTKLEDFELTQPEEMDFV